MRKRIFDIIQIGSKEDLISAICDYVIVASIILNLLVLYVGTFRVPQDLRNFMNHVETVTVVIFVIEYILRVWTADYLYPEKTALKARLTFVFSAFGIIDLFSILPYFLLMLPSGMVAFRVLRVFRIFRLFKINAQYDAFNVIMDVLKNKKEQIISSVCIVLIMMLASSLLMYSVEHEAQPDVFENAFSGVWWSVSTLLTVGYGDIYPVTTLGQIMAIIMSFLGVGLVAIPTGIISAGFVEQYTRMKPLDEVAVGNDIHFIMISLEEKHPWVNKRIAEIQIPPEIIIVTIIRNKDIVIPNGDIVLKEGDEVVLGALEYQDDLDIQLKEFAITLDHPWRGHHIKDIEIPDYTTVVSVLRQGKSLIPKGGTLFQHGDIVTICEKRI